MSEDAVTAKQQEAPALRKRRRVTRKAILIGALIGLCVGCLSVAPLWRLGWYWPVYSFGNFRKVKDAEGARREAWRWIEGRTIRIYRHPAVRVDHTEEVAAGVRALLDDAALDFTVEVHTMPDDVLAAYEGSLVEENAGGGLRRRFLSMKRLQSRLIALREGDPRGEIIITDHPIAETKWAYGMASFSGGLVALTAEHAYFHTAKHEAGHLMGYMKHDSFPLFVIGYPWEGWPRDRNTLMMLLSTNADLSPRARDALQYFWRGVERRTGQKYLRDGN